MPDGTNYTLLNRNMAAAFLGMSISSFDKTRKKDGFPRPVIMLNTSKWIQGNLEQYIEASKEAVQ